VRYNNEHMHAYLSIRKIRFVIGIFVAISLVAPLFINAQATSQSALDATIRAAIMQDPRSASLTSVQIDEMVTALSAKAQTQGLTAQSIAYRLGTPGIVVPGTMSATPTATDPCSLSTWCTVGNYLGSGLARNAVYAAFWVLSLILIIVVWHMRKNPHLTGAHDTPVIGGGI